MPAGRPRLPRRCRGARSLAGRRTRRVLVLCGTSNKRHEALRHLFGSRVSDYWRRGGRGAGRNRDLVSGHRSNGESRSFALSCTDGAVAPVRRRHDGPAPINEPRCWNASIEGHVDVLALARDADQLWAEAADEMYLRGQTGTRPAPP